MSKLLLVIDVQNDFVNENTKEYVNKIQSLVNSNNYENVAFTKFINTEDSLWCKKLNYRGCMTKVGQDIVIDTKNYKVFEKIIYSALNEELKEYIVDKGIKEIYLCGFDTDACVQKTAIDLFESGYDVYVLKDYCMTHCGFEIHNMAIDNLKRLIGRSSIV